MTLPDLIAALEAADGPSRYLDAEIAEEVVGWAASTRHDPWRDPDGRAHHDGPPRYTESLDAALTLVPEGCPVEMHLGPDKACGNATVYTKRVWFDEKDRRCTTYYPHEAKCVRDGALNWNTPALALCIAALRARLAEGR